MSTPMFEQNSNCLEKKDAITRVSLSSAKSDNKANQYYSWILAKSGDIVPERNGQTLHSRYNPQLESERSINSTELCGCTIFWGLGAGYHIASYLHRLDASPKCKFARVLIVEPDSAGLRNILENCDLTKILSHTSVSLAVYDTPEAQKNVEDFLRMVFNPVLQETFTCIPLRPVAEINRTAYDTLCNRINAVMDQVKNDFSVQAHFGKTWTRNILFNLKTVSSGSITELSEYCTKNHKQTAAVIAAGPTLERDIPFLQQNRESLFIATTDTAHQILQAAGITADLFVSIDGQNASHLHAMHGLSGVPFCAVDMCANPVLLRAAIDADCRIILLQGGHPLAQMATQKTGQYGSVFTDAGTVTASAVDIVRQIGFTSVITVGADFANTFGKPYARASYLADLYDNAATRVSPAENAYTALLFRTECTRTGITYTSSLLNRYRTALETYSQGKGIILQTFATRSRQNSFVIRQNKHIAKPLVTVETFFDNYTKSLKELRTCLQNGTPELALSENLHNTLLTVLPVASWYLINQPGQTALIAAVDYSLKVSEQATKIAIAQKKVSTEKTLL